MYDVIVIGARVAGAPTAMLLARKGYKVLLVDRASFPSDTLSTHQIQLRGTAALNRWGLLDPVLATGCPPVEQVSFHTDDIVLSGILPPLDGVGTIVCPRRTLLDKILVDAATDAGAELREDFLVERLSFEGDQVNGVIGRSKSDLAGGEKNFEDHAQLIIGADGKHSLVAHEVKAQEYNVKPVLTCAYYSYWAGVDVNNLELFVLPRGSVGVCPTNNGLTMIYIAYPFTQFQEVRKDIEGSFWKTIDSLPTLTERVHSGRLAERFYGTVDLPAFYRRSSGPGWALVGDAGLTMDPVTGQGIGNAFRDAERIAKAVDTSFSGKKPMQQVLNEYEDSRKEETLAMYEFTSQIATFAAPTREQSELFSALAKKPDATRRFLGALTGSVSIKDFFSMASLFQIMGVSCMGRIFLIRLLTQVKGLTQNN